MKRFLHIFVCLLLSATTLSAQSVSTARVMADRDMNDYVWAVGYGATLEEADKDAINALAGYDLNLASASKTSVANKAAGSDAQSEVSHKRELFIISNMYLDNVRREVLSKQKDQYRVLRYLKRDDWDARHNALHSKIKEYIQSGKYASLVEDRIRYYSWAHILLQTYPDTAEPIMVDGLFAKQWLYNELRQILSKIEVSVIAIMQDGTNRNYPYQLFLDFVYNGEPISYMQFGFFDGRGFVENESVKDGRGMIQVANLEPEITITIDCLNRELARQIEPSVALILENQLYTSTFDEAQKRVKTKQEGVKPQKRVDTSSEKVISQVNKQLAKSEETYVEVKEQVDTARPYLKIMADVAKSISRQSAQDVRHHFTDVAWEQYQNIVANGNPIIARTPDYKLIEYDTLTICQSLPLKLNFKGNHSFVEDVVLRVNNKTLKVESVAYKLGAKTEQTIMSMAWDDKARLTLISFLEDYRSAYCLRNLEYIDKVFAEDAYIIVGTVLKQSNRKFSDLPYSVTKYEQKSKQQYISDLQKSFASKEFINLRFEECNVAKGYYAKEGIYAVQVNQLYFSNNYADNGILTLAIDMREEANPLVRVRVWQDARDVNYNAEQMIERTVSVDKGLN